MSNNKPARKVVYHDRPKPIKPSRRHDSPHAGLREQVTDILEKYVRRQNDPVFAAECAAEEARYDSECVTVQGKRIHPTEVAKQFGDSLTHLVRARKEYKDSIFVDVVKFAKEAYSAGIDLGGDEAEIQRQLLASYGESGKKKAKQLLLVYWPASELLSEFVHG